MIVGWMKLQLVLRRSSARAPGESLGLGQPHPYARVTELHRFPITLQVIQWLLILLDLST